jgi:uncharacterized protein (DUF1800 family)
MTKKTLFAWTATVALSAAISFGAAAQANVTGTTIVEYLHAESNKFYLSAITAEWALLDDNPQYGWKRTGVTFSAAAQGQTPGAQPVCRYYIIGAGSHFFSVDPAECALVATYPQFYLNEGIGWYAIPATGDTCPANTASLYRAYNNGAALRKASNHRYFTDVSFYQSYAAKGYALEGLKMCLPLSATEKRADASRLLFQASFGARTSDVDAVMARGASGWIDDQLNANVSRYTPRDWVSLTRPDACVNNTTPPLTATSYCARDNYSLFQTQREFFQHAINSSDQLKQRLAWSWSQFFVVNAAEVGLAYGMGDYQQMLRDNATANFKTLLTKVTLHPAMGRMLDMANNLKPDTARGVAPNENYAREIMQLFSLGLYQLNNDGTLKRDAKGLPMDTYSQEEVEDLAHVFTGWTYPTVAGQTPRNLNPANTKGVMEERVAQHDTAARPLLGGIVPAGLTQSQRLDKALDLIFNHPNVPPFVSKFLIQQFVTGEPSPAYVDRIAKVFQNNGAGVRGDMKAVIKAVLMDVEARGAAKWAPNYGHQSEPVLMMTRLARAMNAQTDGVYFRTTTGGAGQSVFGAASVFNFYPPDYTLTKSGVIAPEFALYNTSSAISRVNAAYGTIFGNITPDATVFGATGTQFDLSSYTALATNPTALLDRMNDVLFAGRMTASTRAIIQPAIEAVNASDASARVKAALYLSIAAPETQVLR